MATYSAHPWIVAARTSNLWDVSVVQTADFSSSDVNGFYQFTDGTGSKLSYTVPNDKKAFLRWLSIQPASSTMYATIAFYLDGSITDVRIAMPTGGARILDLTSIAGIGGGYIAAASEIGVLIKPSVLNVDVDAAFGGWLE